MERFVFVAAIVFAVIFGLFAMVGGGRHFHFSIDGRTDPVMAVAAGHVPAATFTGEELRFKYLAAHVTITPEDRQDISIEITNPGHAPMPTVVRDGEDIVVDGHLANRVDCDDAGGADLRGYSRVALADLPQIVVHAPRTLHVDFDGAGLAEVGPSQSLHLEVSGCGSANAADVAGALGVDVRGSGHVQAGAAHGLNANIMGSGGLTTGAIADSADVSVFGSGSVTVASLTGTLKSSSHGSGDINVLTGTITTAEFETFGSGGANVSAPIQHLRASIHGSGDIEVNGAVGDVDAAIYGSGAVHATSITGAIHKQTMGSGDVTSG
ncbi:MAG: DUF2807 domain-containing protein [Proteobacteria bacterium]|nr:DUF2807 domain-containing protein [Pseudomonadota bacterium]